MAKRILIFLSVFLFIFFQTSIITTQQPGRGSRYFDGGDDYGLIPDHADFDVDYLTVEAWVYYYKGTGGDDATPISRDQFTGERLWNFHIKPSYFWVFDEDSTIIILLNVPLINESWAHYAMTYDGDDLIIYENGKRIASETGTGKPAKHGSRAIFLGKQENSTKGWFDGSIDDFRFWNYARTPDQIKSWWSKSIPGKYPGLIINMKFNEETGNLVDYSGNNHNTTIVSGTRAVQSGEGKVSLE